MASNSVYYMERRSRQAKRFWQIQVKKKSTVVRCGLIQRSDRGRLYPARSHTSFKHALKFAQKNIKKKRKLGYILKRGKTARKFVPKDKRVNKPSGAGKRKQRISQPKKKQKSPRTDVRQQTPSPVPPTGSLQKQATLPVAVEKQNSRVTAEKPSLAKQQSLTVGSEKVYLPPKNKWPVKMEMPVSWRFRFKEQSSYAFGIYVDEDRCFFGHDDGQVFELDSNGQVIRIYKLPNGVKCITKDGEFLYVGCNDGGLYDLTHGEPRKMCVIEDCRQIYWLDVLRGMLCASDADGSCALVNYEGEVIWKKKSPGTAGWMVRMDETGIYHGYSNGVTKYAAQNGKEIWQHKCSGYVFFGVQDEDCIHIAQDKEGQKIDKKSGKLIQKYNAGNSAFALCNEAANGLVFLADDGSVRVCDEASGKLIYNFKQKSNNHSIVSMQYHQGRLYCVGRSEFKVLDLSEKAIKAVQKKQNLEAVELHADAAAPVVSEMTRVESVSSAEVARGGIIVHCVKDKGKLRIRALTDGYNKNWNCQFPKEIRREGAKYVVDELRETKFFSGKYYRVFGSIKEITD